MKKTFFTLLLNLFMSMVGLQAFAWDGVEVDGLYYELDMFSLQARVTLMDEGRRRYSGDIVIPSNISIGEEVYSVTSIGDEAFYNCSGLTSITIPNSVTSIGNLAFHNCSGLTSITIPNSVMSIGYGTFSGCSSLTSITIPNSVTSIDQGAFSGCSGLTSITIPNSVKSIDQGAFSGCSSLTSITIPNSVTSIDQRAFSGCSGLTTIKVESGNTIYDSRDNCNAIIETASKTLVAGCKNTIIPNSVTSIGNYAFYNCSSLTSITIPNSVTNIGNYAFSGCSELTSVTIGSSVTSIGSSAFENCSGLTSITIPNSVMSIGYGTFSGCSGLSSVTIGNRMTSIGKSAFSGCTVLTSLNLSCEVIGTWFTGSVISSLTEITLTEGVKIVKENAFKGCTNIKTIDIGSTITSIEARAFSGTDKLTDVICRATTVPETDRTAFENSYPHYATLHVPAVSQTAFKETAPWSEFKKIVAINQDLPDDAEQCAIPTISYQNGNLLFSCITEGVEYQYQITDNDIKSGAGTEVSLDATYHINVYATKTGYKDSELATATLCWIDQKPATEGIMDGVANIPANAVLIQSVDGMLSVSGVSAGTAINIYDLSGKMTGSAKASSGTTTIATNLRSGEVGVLKIGDKSVKYVVQ